MSSAKDSPELRNQSVRGLPACVSAMDSLPFRLHARAEFEEVGRKLLGDGSVSALLREIKGALARQFGARLQVGINFLIASGYVLPLWGENQIAKELLQDDWIILRMGVQ